MAKKATDPTPQQQREAIEKREDAVNLAPPPAPVSFPARRDWTHVVNGLTRERDALERLAEAAEKAHRPAIARELRVDVAAIDDRLLVEVRGQGELDLMSTESVQGALELLLHDVLHLAVEASPRPRLVDIERRTARRLLELAYRVYDRGWERGYQARRDDPDLQIALAADAARHKITEEEKGEQHGVGG